MCGTLEMALKAYLHPRHQHSTDEALMLTGRFLSCQAGVVDSVFEFFEVISNVGSISVKCCFTFTFGSVFVAQHWGLVPLVSPFVARKSDNRASVPPWWSWSRHSARSGFLPGTAVQ